MSQPRLQNIQAITVIVAALFLLFGTFFALMTIFGMLRGYSGAPAYAFLMFYACVGVAFSNNSNA